MKNYELKRFNQPTLKKVEIEEGRVDNYLLKYSDFEIFDSVLNGYETTNSIVDNKDEEGKLKYIERRKAKIVKYFEGNLHGFYQKVLDIHKDDLDKYITKSRREIIHNGKVVVEISFLNLYGNISMELLDKDSLRLFEEVADKLAKAIGLNIYEPYTKHEHIPIRSYFKKED